MAHRLPIRYSELYHAKRLAFERLEEIASIIESNTKWWKISKLSNIEIKELEQEEIQLLECIRDIHLTFIDNIKLVNSQIEPDYPVL